MKYKGKVRIKGLNINKSFNLVKKVERNEEKKKKKGKIGDAKGKAFKLQSVTVRQVTVCLNDSCDL